MKELPEVWKRSVPSPADALFEFRQRSRYGDSADSPVPVPKTGDPVRDQLITVHRVARRDLNADVKRVRGMDDTDPRKSDEIARVQEAMRLYNDASYMSPEYFDDSELDLFRQRIEAEESESRS